jgi:hypothetical protein
MEFMAMSRLRVGMIALCVACSSLLLAASALAFTDDYGGYVICGSPSSTCYIESDAAHTFNDNYGDSVGQATSLACQLFNHTGTANVVSHAYQHCHVHYSGSAYVWARVYNQSAFSDYVIGEAIT